MFYNINEMTITYFNRQKDLENRCIALEDMKNKGDSLKYEIDLENKIIKGVLSEDTAIYRTFDEIRSIAVEVDGKTTVNTSLASIVGRAAVGSLFGGVGAIIGGVTAGKRENKVVKTVKLKISFKGALSPTEITLYHHGYFGGHTPKSAEEKANEIHDVVEKYLSLAANQSNSPMSGAPDNLASQLISLADLHKQGVLTDSEFQSAKEQLLAK